MTDRTCYLCDMIFMGVSIKCTYKGKEWECPSLKAYNETKYKKESNYETKNSKEN